MIGHLFVIILIILVLEFIKRSLIFLVYNLQQYPLVGVIIDQYSRRATIISVKSSCFQIVLPNVQ